MGTFPLMRHSIYTTMVLIYKNIKKRIEEGKKSDMGQAIVKRDQWLCHPINLIGPPPLPPLASCCCCADVTSSFI
jgi:hypothetical protein